MQPDDPIGIGIGEGPKEHAVDDAEDGCGGANAEAERQNRHHRVRLGAEEEPHPIAQVAEKVLEERGPILVARLLLEVFDSAELDERLAARFVRRHSGVTVLLGLLVDVKADLFVEPALLLPAVPQPPPQFAHVPLGRPLRSFENQVDGARQPAPVRQFVGEIPSTLLVSA